MRVVMQEKIDPSECTHMMDELPSWQSANQHKRIRAMMTQMGQTKLVNQETMRIVTGGANDA
jgi:hypothetical protein